jgi:hypothetical protein
VPVALAASRRILFEAIALLSTRGGAFAGPLGALSVTSSEEKELMRKTPIWPVVLVLGALAFPNVASATPTVKMRAQILPIPGFPHTGDYLGAGADGHGEFTIEGTEYFGSPPPIIGVNFFLPSGTKVHTTGFPTCSKTTIERIGPVGCPQGSTAAAGEAVGFVTFGGERVEEPAELSAFFAPGGGFEFFADGHSPVSLEILGYAHLVNLGSAGNTGPELVGEVPLVASVPGAPYASVRSIDVTAGAAYRSHGHTVYLGRVPMKCPKAGFTVKAEVIFAENGEASKPETVSTSETLPCPRSLSR